MTSRLLVAAAAILAAQLGFAKELKATPKPSVDPLIPWLLQEDAQLRGLPFAEGIADATGKKLSRWDLVDLAHSQVKLKAEFQGRNHDLCRPKVIVATSAK